ncbi:ATP-binding cassette domain-containing protein [Algoriphagus sp. AGSA1]|uniref:ABC transporter ATP-binding protein n=1 Tax=Algoriphagus sp. AGSA1 TaxID=2907213 RepID=UPI001F3C6DAE|nr:ATP-binding cassette domain-containing protein [Algoriphagus sp. AGSA1]MCE7054639.1 ATP-binding cassette domain-containing protein [Algoriphagus sp. AGSA1]
MQHNCINEVCYVGLNSRNYIAMLKTNALSFEYDANNRFEFPDLSVEDGADQLILGESGIGKTTFLHLIAGLLPPKTGKIFIKETNITRLKGKELDAFRGQYIGIIFQQPHFIHSLTLGENLAMIQYLGKKKSDPDRVRSVLDCLGLLSKIKDRPHLLSQGEQQRAAIALAVVNEPKLILADEPTAALDDKNCIKVIELLRSQTKINKASLVIITHDQRLKAQFNNAVTLTDRSVDQPITSEL